jgi:hypothetical protein
MDGNTFHVSNFMRGSPTELKCGYFPIAGSQTSLCSTEVEICCRYSHETSVCYVVCSTVTIVLTAGVLTYFSISSHGFANNLSSQHWVDLCKIR